jgi:hypothetical protein
MEEPHHTRHESEAITASFPDQNSSCFLKTLKADELLQSIRDEQQPGGT